jgi:hypothetical protein
MIINLFLFSIVIAFIVAKFEINIEGKNGWAESLPTWRVKNWFTRLFWGEQPYTGYHFWFLMMVLAFMHYPFVVGLPWSLDKELLFIAAFLFSTVVEDFFWFVLNPHFGIKKFNKIHAHWHLDWIGRVPKLYVRLLGIAAVLIVVSFQI